MTVRRAVRVGAGAVAGALGLITLLAGAAPAHAATTTAPMLVRRVDSTSMPHVSVDVATGGRPLSQRGLSLIENGKRISTATVQSLGTAQVPTATVLVVDTASTMNGAKIFATRLALKELIAAKSPNDTMAVVAFGSSARTVQG